MRSLSSFSVLAATMAIATAFSGAALAADAFPGAASPSAARSTVVAVPMDSLSSNHLQAHQADLEAMITDLSRVQTPAAAKEYEGYLNGQIGKYVQNHKTLHHVGVPSFRNGKFKLNGAGQANQQAIADATERLSQTHFPRVAMEMDRVEKLNPNLKKNFDVLRDLD